MSQIKDVVSVKYCSLFHLVLIRNIIFGNRHPPAPWGSGFPRPGDMVYSARYRGGAPVEHSRYVGLCAGRGSGRWVLWCMASTDPTTTSLWGEGG